MLLAMVAIIDFCDLVIPDVLNAAILVLGLSEVVIAEQQDMGLAIGSVAVVGSAALAVRATYFALRGVHGLGMGDVKFLAAAGPWVGVSGLPWLLLIASFSGLAFAVVKHLAVGGLDAKSRLPFGPHLALGLFCTWILRMQDLV